MRNRIDPRAPRSTPSARHDPHPRARRAFRAVTLAALGALAACAVLPEGLDAERERAAAASADYATPYPERALPELPPAPELLPLWARTLRAHGELESAWHAWQARLDAVTRAASFPNTNVELSAEHALPMEGRSAWDRTTLRAGFDPMQSLWGRGKLAAAGEAALAEARVAGERFRARRAELKRALVEAWIEWLAAREEARLVADALELEQLAVASRDARAGGGGEVALLVEARIAAGRARDEAARADVRDATRLAALNALLARAPDAPLEPPAAWPRRELALSLDALQTLAAERDPVRAERRAETDARERELVLARKEGRPDVAPMLGVVGSLETFVGASLSLPLNRQRVRALVAEARSALRAAEADARQAERDRRAALATAHRVFEDAERARALFADELLPLAARACDDAEAACAVLGSSTDEWIEVRRMQIEVRRVELEARVARELALAEIEEGLGTDLEGLAEETNHE
ncbi:MAG: TolC family protein [Planctomycetes bacterium]|nr:TolC family protein [Planctomycetota bacterium]